MYIFRTKAVLIRLINLQTDKLCNESNTTGDTDWGVVLELCDKIKEYEKGFVKFFFFTFINFMLLYF